ncbi:hypothetical protein QT386_11995 [Solimonas sp. SE-A11]|nr:hypothetical protein [Solimonas sp. SE-A11]
MKKKGKGKTPSMSCKQEADAEKINDFAETRMNDKSRDAYSWNPFNFNACTSFASDALDAGMPE